MTLPDFIEALPQLAIPFPAEAVNTHAMRSEHGLCSFFTFHRDFDLAPHVHKAQWGMVVQGKARLTIGGETRTYLPGETYNIPSGVEHSGHFPAGTVVVDFFEEADRYPLKT